MKRPVAIVVLASVQAAISIGLIFFPFITDIHGRYGQLMGVLAAGYFLSALLLWRLNWFGPIVFVAMWIASHWPSAFLSAIMSVDVFSFIFPLAYLFVVWKYHDRFTFRVQGPPPAAKPS